ncbi:MAG: ABC transporter ATP-binding protein [Lentisphaerae bacterium GWF2_44_16]|nr:MAG: ABC transporter ATP-binding protein [Lentisphaerae bacterium GWF2_44_16]
MIKVENLYKWYGTKLAVEDISFSVNKGEILGFIGPNGAGKSTTMRMITGFIPISKGRACVGGFDIEANPIEAKALFGYLPENAPLYANMTVRDFLLFCLELRGFRGKQLKEKTDKVIHTCFLNSVQHQNIDTLSKGYRHRTCFAQSIIHDPDVLVLDEPTDGLDPNQKREIRNLIKEMGKNKAIILSTHILEEVEAVCSRVLVIDKGRKVFDGTPDTLKGKSEKAGIIHVEIFSSDAAALTSKLQELDGVLRAEIEKEDGDFAVLKVFPDRTRPSQELCSMIHEVSVKERWKLGELKVEQGRLDEVFHCITGNDA